MAVVYEHIRKDNNQPLYVGICHQHLIDERPYSTERNRVWESVVQLTDYEVVITHTNISWKEAGKIEKSRVSELGRIIYGTGILTNILDGGTNEYKNCDMKEIQELYKKYGYKKKPKIRTNLYTKVHFDISLIEYRSWWRTDSSSLEERYEMLRLREKRGDIKRTLKKRKQIVQKQVEKQLREYQKSERKRIFIEQQQEKTRIRLEHKLQKKLPQPLPTKEERKLIKKERKSAISRVRKFSGRY